LITLDRWEWWVALVFGVLVTRVIFERTLLAFLTYDRLGEIVDLLRQLAANDKVNGKMP
jgi:hypothetical protein